MDGITSDLRRTRYSVCYSRNSRRGHAEIKRRFCDATFRVVGNASAEFMGRWYSEVHLNSCVAALVVVAASSGYTHVAAPPTCARSRAYDRASRTRTGRGTRAVRRGPPCRRRRRRGLPVAYAPGTGVSAIRCAHV